ncbi:MAG: hypothetical protein J5I90_11210 [Caldilineales bacterium]|nr:hypothetical protein [Caldilineales bacterium]
MPKRILPLLFLIAATTLLLSGCISTLLPEFGPADPTELVYTAPAQKTIIAGEKLAGTGIEYVGLAGDNGAEVRIDGQSAFKKVADSVDWIGPLTDDATLELALRVLFYNDRAMRLAGTNSIIIQNPEPSGLQQRPSGIVEYVLPVTYQLSVGDTVPGSTLVLESIDPDRGAQFTGWPTEQFPYRKLADSLQWFGTVRPEIGNWLDLRVAWLGDDDVQLAGFAHVYVTP